MHAPLQGIAELPSYARLADKLLTVQERQELISHLAQHPQDGDLMEGTGGVRKLRYLTKAERNELAGLVDILRSIWKGRKP